jgi:DNA-binding transcriptional regulator YhcF (GntR family)
LQFVSFSLDRGSRLTFAAQVQQQAEAQLVAGRLHPGDRLPSVRQLARQLGISRTTAERIHETLCEATLAQSRPRSGAFVATRETEWSKQTEWAHTVYDFLKTTVQRARELGLDAARLSELLRALGEENASPSHGTMAVFPVLVTRDAFECMERCLDRSFPGQLIHISPTAPHIRLPPRTRFVLSGYYMREQARKFAEALGCDVLYVRYNVRLLDESMSIPRNEHRYFVTRDEDNASMTRAFLASAYPEVPRSQYTVAALSAWLADGNAAEGLGQVWVTVTALDQIRAHVPPARLRLLHPLLAEDFVEGLRCLALCG